MILVRIKGKISFILIINSDIALLISFFPPKFKSHLSGSQCYSVLQYCSHALGAITVYQCKELYKPIEQFLGVKVLCLVAGENQMESNQRNDDNHSLDVLRRWAGLCWTIAADNEARGPPSNIVFCQIIIFLPRHPSRNPFPRSMWSPSPSWPFLRGIFVLGTIVIYPFNLVQSGTVVTSRQHCRLTI